MFWIGLIVGIIIPIALVVAWFALSCLLGGITLDDCKRMFMLGYAVGDNRTCTVEVWHDDECVHSDTFEEH